MKQSVMLKDCLGAHISDISLVLSVKGQVLHRERAHLKVPGYSLVLSALLTKKLPTFLSRLNEISGDCEKILLVSGSFGTFKCSASSRCKTAESVSIFLDESGRGKKTLPAASTFFYLLLMQSNGVSPVSTCQACLS